MIQDRADSRGSVSPWPGLLALWVLSAMQLGAQLVMNGGAFCFTLDDPYIHLALAENLWAHGHYGVNLGEFSAPSSSILWPFLVAPISGHPGAVLALNLVFASATVVVFARCLSLWPSPRQDQGRSRVLRAILIALVVATNQVGLAFLGMEHSMQLCIAALLACGLLLVQFQGRWPHWIWPVAWLSVLVRYEMLALVAGVFVVAWLKGQKEKVLGCAGVIGVSLAGFSWGLRSMGLGILPSSIRAKVAVGPELSAFQGVLSQALRTVSHPQGIFMLCGVVWMLLGWRRRSDRGRGLENDGLAVALVVACVSHFAVGKYGWFSRYEVYVWAFFLLLGGAIVGKEWPEQVQAWIKRSGPGRFGLYCGLGLVASSFLYLWALVIGPLGSNNIFEQQFQMHRLVQQAQPLPVAVNDLGWVAYRNKSYVLDLWGLGSERARKARFSSVRNSDWMETLAQEHKIRLIMVYDEWFSALPETWQRLGELHLGKERITPAHPKVVFYLRSSQDQAELCSALERWERALPEGVVFRSFCSER